MSIKKQNFIRLTLTYLVILIMFAVILYPLAWIIGSSFNPGQSLSGSSMIPKHATLAHYKELFDTSQMNYVYWYMNSVKVSVLTMIFTVILEV